MLLSPGAGESQFSQSKYRGGVCNKGKALSTGAIVGIAIGCLVFVAALVAVIFLWMRSRKLNRLVRCLAPSLLVLPCPPCLQPGPGPTAQGPKARALPCARCDPETLICYKSTRPIDSGDSQRQKEYDWWCRYQIRPGLNL